MRAESDEEEMSAPAAGSQPSAPPPDVNPDIGTVLLSQEVKTERLLSEVLSEILDGRTVSPTDHFFDDLEADSLVMAHFCARVKKRSGLPPVSIKEVYRNPTIELLAAAISRVNATAPSVEEDAGSGIPLQVSSRLSSVVSPQTPLTVGAARPEPVRGWRYTRCGALQLLPYLGVVFVSALVITQAYEWTSAASGAASTYYRAAILGGGTFVAWSTLPILTKWALVG
ncbi:MAG: peptide synthetase, partial [Actinomycetia bacterium]|nr:peptide synthetase [Actinomycetes bacterium]